MNFGSRFNQQFKSNRADLTCSESQSILKMWCVISQTGYSNALNPNKISPFSQIIRCRSSQQWYIHSWKFYRLPLATFWSIKSQNFRISSRCLQTLMFMCKCLGIGIAARRNLKLPKIPIYSRYCGHGSGMQFISSYETCQLSTNAVVFLMGCSSVALKSVFGYSLATSAHHYYHIAKR